MRKKKGEEEEESEERGEGKTILSKLGKKLALLLLITYGLF